MFGLAFGVSLVVLLIGTASAAPVTGLRATTTYAPPYSGTPGATFIGLATGCGSTGSIVVFPSFNLTSGKGLGSTKVSASSCGATNSSMQIELSAGFNSTSFTTTSGLHRFVAHWTLTFVVKLAASAGSSTQFAEAVFFVAEGIGIHDNTNGTTFVGATSKLLYDAITSGTYTHTYSKIKETSWNNATLVKGHSYSMQLGLDIVTVAGVTAGKSTASASVAMAGGSDDFLLTSVTMT